MAALIISCVSLLLQLYTVTLAIRLLFVTKHRLAWGGIAAGLLLIFFRRIFELSAYLDLNQFDINLTYTLISFFVSLSMAIGMHLAKRMIDRMMETSERLTVSEAYYRGLMEYGTEAIFIADANGNYINANPRALELVGYTFDQITSMNIRDLADREELERFPIQSERLREGELLVYRRTLVRACGERFVAELHTRQLPDGNLMASVRDISAHVEAQERLAFQANILDTVQQAVVAFDLEGCVLYHNQYAAEMYGWTGRSVIGQPIAQTMRPAMKEELITRVQECLATGRRWTGEITYLDEHGVPHPAMLVQSPLFDNAMTRVGSIGISFDISDLQAAEQSAARSESLLREFINSAPFGAHHYELTPDGDLLFAGANQTAERILGIDHSALIGKKIEEAFPGVIESSIPEIYRSVANTGVAWDSSQVKYEEGLIDGSFEVAAFQTGPNRMVALFKDVTDRVRAEEALRQRELRLQIVNDIARGIVAHESPDSIIERALMSIFQAYPKHRVVYASVSRAGLWEARRSLQPAGYSSLAGATIDLSLLPEHREKLGQRQFITLDFSPGAQLEPSLAHEFASARGVAAVLCVPIILEKELIGCLAFDASKPVVWNEHEIRLLLEVASYLEIVFRDQRQDDLRAAAELALRESDDRFRMALQNSDIIMFRQDTDLRYTWNHNSKEPSLNDYIVGRTDHQILPTELADRLTGIKREVMASRRGRQFETELVFRNETTYWNCRLEPLFDANDEVVGISGVSVNITERRMMEMELRKSETRFRTLADNLPAIVWVADANGDCSYFSHATIELSGLSHDELTGKQWLQVIHPEDRDEFISLYRSAISARFPFETTLRVRDAGGDYRHVLMRGVPQFAEEELTGYVGTCFDITERLESENRLRESEARLEEAQRVAHVGSFELNASTGSVFWSDELYRIFGLDPGTFVPRVESVQQFIHHNDRADVIRQRLEAIDRHEEYALEFRIVRPDGEIRWVRSSSRPTYNADGGLVKVIGTVIDITSQHHAEAELHQREARFHTFMDNSPAVVFMKDLEGKYLYFNAAFATTFNVALADWIGHDDTEFWPPEIAAAFQKVDRQVIDSGQPMQLIEQVAHQDGIHQWFSYKFPICDAGGKPEALAGIAIDLTEQFRAQAEQAASEQRHRSLVDLLPDGLYIQCDRIVQYASPSLATMLGYSSPYDLVGKHVLALFHQNSHELVQQRIGQLEAGTEKLPAIEEQLLRADGTSLECEVRAVRTTWNGRPSVQVVVSDITERKKAEADRQHLEDQLRLSQKLETIGTMAAGIAHDFNNLLVPIIGYSELVASEELHGKFSAEYLQEVLKAAYRAKGLVAQILAFSRQQTGDRKPSQIDHLIDEVIGMLRQTSGQSIRFDHITPGGIPDVMADSTQMVQVLMNVCVNATQAMPHGGSITIRTVPPESVPLACPNCKRKLHGKMVRIEISDTGCGMDGATLKRIFDPFFTTKSVGQGTGLGLAVTHGIITQHSGHICAESILGQGTTFHIFLPVAEAMKSRFHPEIAAPVVGGTESILIIDDEPAVAHSHAATLKSLGYRVTVATEARAALDLFGKNPAAIDLVLLDQRMPDLTGDQLAVQMLRLRPDLPIVICSGYSEALNLRSAQDLGIRDVIMKPVVTSELNRALRAALDGRQTTVVS